MAMQLDEIDVRLLRELETDADRPNVELARLIGLSPAATLNRVRRLKESGELDVGPVGIRLQLPEQSDVDFIKLDGHRAKQYFV